jgi:very-short-patch-repair endonuclease
MCVIGNPPYAVSSTNKNEWIQNLIADYKKDLNERKINIDDDYIKFIRYGQYFIDKNGEGILAYISSNSFLDGVTHRQMRKHLLESFDSIYIIDLHGNAKKKEVSPDGSTDQNVFDIMTGVSINIFIKSSSKKSKSLGKVFHSEIFGTRENKYNYLSDYSIRSISWKKIEYQDPYYFYIPKDFSKENSYENGINLELLFNNKNTGIQTKNDLLTLKFTKDEILKLETDFQQLDIDNLRKKYGVNDGTWKLEDAKKDILSGNYDHIKILVKAFDTRFTLLNRKSSGFLGRPRFDTMKHMIPNNNLALLVSRQNKSSSIDSFFLTKYCSEMKSAERTIQSYHFPLYIYPEINPQQTIYKTTERTPNLNAEIVKQIAEKLGLTFVPEKNSPLLEGCPSGGVVFSPNPTNTSQKEILTTINNIPIYRNFVENLPHNPALNQLAKDKRKEGILSEVLFWQQVHKGVFYKIDFDRQRIIGNYIVDFYVKALGLVIEIDGNSHDEKQEYDAKRQAYLESFGLKVFRCRDIDVKKNINAVFTALEKFIINEYGEKTTPAFSHPSTGGEFSPIDILDYIYAVLHSPNYREKYKEFLKIDFPRVPYPTDQATFWQLVKLGGEIRQIHLLESPIVENYITQYPEDGDNVVVKPIYKDGRVYISETQYFDNVPQIAWEFYIGGYQPAQKWLKDRKDRKLEFEDILHYQKIIVALSETDRLMKEIDKVVGEW